MAKTKSKKSSKSGRDSKPKYLGVKLYSGQKANIGQIVIRQRGTKFLPGENIGQGKDDTLFAMKPGIVQFKTIKKKGFGNLQRIAKKVNIVSKKV